MQEIGRDDDRARQEYGPRQFAPIHPGQILSLEYMEPSGLTQSHLARDLKLPFRRVHEIVNGKRAISAETAFILAKYFGTEPQYWLDLQAHYALACARDGIQGHLATIRPMAMPDSWATFFERPSTVPADFLTERQDPPPQSQDLF